VHEAEVRCALQVSVHIKGRTECFECQPKPTSKTFPVCTLRNTPDKPIHCVVWAKEMLFPLLFGAPEASDMNEALPTNLSTLIRLYTIVPSPLRSVNTCYHMCRMQVMIMMPWLASTNPQTTPAFINVKRVNPARVLLSGCSGMSSSSWLAIFNVSTSASVHDATWDCLRDGTWYLSTHVQAAVLHKYQRAAQAGGFVALPPPAASSRLGCAA
jgi:hypothetical protein